ncbi:hypothetical protein VD0002_g3337 [Verticillium dahliae]|uniref:WSC domain-containing protein n=2 Tax=Verticillium dahliae TaxID=27337 RepID=G2WZV2_VERDV|nr:uncharacterized protein VDAG_03544 [Verticillium dahliae VdLs.17]KAF3346541.1 hypothetical protein VdG2_05201 [Verticillium dahliae VDG2]KAH6703952.1 hypothetical protein EV126DRAFT_417430 [Verticillium dahliae]EGY22104.1 hypothetical protein VDAG_03544 [Verticillium dahliae VdLs.17]PNH29027.1 hypothetical protein BJF96_g7691 [Verticillium dahliae]PNH40660.1 hypothetical protein VD0004_g6354 [Verticillium dahliae]
MVASHLKLAIGLTAASNVVAFSSIRIAPTVEAGKEVEVSIVNDLEDSDSFDAGFEKFRVYLATTPPGWGTGPACYLVNATAIDETSVKVTIPPSVVPHGSDVMISVMEFNEDPSLDGPSGFQYSNEFTLNGGKGEWSKPELEGFNIGDSDTIPCEAYACARDCMVQFYPDNKEDESAYKKTYECTAECPGVDYPAWDSLPGVDEVPSDNDGDDEGDDDEETASISGATSGTATPSSGAATTILTTTGADEASASTETPSSAGRHTASLMLLAGIIGMCSLF